MTRSFVVVAALSMAYVTSGCTAAQKQQFKDFGAELKEAGVAFTKDVKDQVVEGVKDALPDIKAEAERIITEALDKQAKELLAKEIAKLDAQLATLPPEVETDPLTGMEREITRTAMDFDGADGQPKDGELDEKEMAALGKWYGIRLAAITAEGVMDAGQVQQHATGTGITMAGILAIMLARKGGRQALAGLLRSGGGSATAGVAG